VVVAREGAVAWVTLARAEAANALSRGLVAGLRARLGELAAERDLRVIVLTGAGDKAFCAGADLKERRTFTTDETRAFLADLNAAVDALAAFPRPVIAALNGAAFGGGLELALACDLRIAAEHVSLGLPEVQLGIIPGAGGTQRLARACGIAVAKELVLTGRRIDARRALDLGLVSAVVPPGDLRTDARRLAQEIANAGPLAVACARRAIDLGFGRPLAEGLAIERDCYEVVLGSADRDEGLAAFAEKRRPRYEGR
jgi:enoyl-CoA hydratase/carnithine racemase